MRTLRVPDRVTAPIRRLCNRITPGTKALFIPVCPEPDGQPTYCFQNVMQKMARDGGEMACGWSVWFLPGIWMEAEFHAVWKSPEDALVDISPPIIDTKRILFIPDAVHKYQGRQIDNIRIPLSKDPRVKELIALGEEKFRVMNEGELAYKTGAIPVKKEKILPILQRMSAIGQELGISDMLPNPMPDLR